MPARRTSQPEKRERFPHPFQGVIKKAKERVTLVTKSKETYRQTFYLRLTLLTRLKLTLPLCLELIIICPWRASRVNATAFLILPTSQAFSK